MRLPYSICLLFFQAKIFDELMKKIILYGTTCDNSLRWLTDWNDFQVLKEYLTQRTNQSYC